MNLFRRIHHWLRPPPSTQTARPDPVPAGTARGVVDHVIILDGTMASLTPGQDSNAGRAFHLIREHTAGNRRSVYYEAGLQWRGWRGAWHVIQGRGINRQICRAYSYLASHYRPGDRIFLFGYSRGAYAVRSLAGVIDRVGLLRREDAIERNIRQIYRFYKTGPDSPAARQFAHRYCHPEAPIQMVGVWDTVKALGIRLPLLWLWSEGKHAFHNHHLGSSIRHGYHALALDETRAVFTPVLWDCPPGWENNIEQVWFRGAHSDIGGQLGQFEAARPLANIPLVWMLERAEACGLALPFGWHERYPCNPAAPMTGTWRGWGWAFWLRGRRAIGQDRSERLHPSAQQAEPRYWTLYFGKKTNP